MAKKVKGVPKRSTRASTSPSPAPIRPAGSMAVNGDPIPDIQELEHVRFVMKEGKVYRQ